MELVETETASDATPSLHLQLSKYRGALAGLATNMGYSRQHIIDVLRGNSQNAFITREAEKLLTKLQTDV